MKLRGRYALIKLEDLDENEKMLMIEFLPKHEVIQFLKKNSKKFSKELAGVRLDKKSRLLEQRLPRTLLKAFEQEDKVTVSFIKKTIYIRLEEINQYIKLKLGLEEGISRIIQSKKKDDYIKLVDVLLEKIESQCILLFLNLNGIKVNMEQKKLIEISIEEVVLYKKIKEMLKEEKKEKLEAQYNEQIKIIEEKGQALLKIEKDKNRTLSYQILEKHNIIEEERQNINEKIKEIKKQQKNYENLKNKLARAEADIKKTNEELNTKQEDLQQDLEKERQKNKELQIINEAQILKINQLHNELNERYEIYSKKYIVRWEKENQEILDQKRCLIKEISRLYDTIKVLQNEVMDLEKEKEKAQEKLSEYNSLVTNFINNIDKELITSTLKSSILNIRIPDQAKENHMQLYIKNQSKNDEIEICESIDEWSGVIAENLKNIGVRKNVSEWSDYMISVLAAKTIPLIVGCKTREIAKAISCAYAGETPFIITLPGGYSDINELIELYHNCEAKVILIEGAVGQMNESLMLPLFKEYIEADENNKLILISCEDTNMVNLMPSYLFEYMVPIEIMDIRPIMQHNYVYTNSTRVLQLFRKNQLDINDSYKKLSKLLKDIEIINAYINTRTLILAYLCRIRDIKNALECLSICDLKVMFKDDDVREIIANNIDNYQDNFTQELKNLIVGEVI